MRAFPLVVALCALAPPACALDAAQNAPPQAGELKSFRDWVVGCDNLRNCAALGLGPGEGVGGAFLRVARGGEAGSTPRVSISVVSDAGAARPRLALNLDGRAATGAPLAARRDGDFLTADLGAEATRFLDAARNAKTLGVRVVGVPKTGFTISLSGAAAALLYMDAAQLRVGSTTALVDRGEAPPSSIPAAPEAPVVAAERMRLVNPPPALPAALKPADDPSCQDYPPIAVALTRGRTLWGICALAAAYNFAYRFSLVDAAGAAKAAVFAVPGRPAEPDDDPSVLVNPGLTDGGRTLAMLNKGRGIGDCGETARWGFDGEAFRAVSYARMDACRGVPPENWPTLYSAPLR